LTKIKIVRKFSLTFSLILSHTGTGTVLVVVEVAGTVEKETYQLLASAKMLIKPSADLSLCNIGTRKESCSAASHEFKKKETLEQYPRNCT
jgi:hypothetical protein